MNPSRPIHCLVAKQFIEQYKEKKKRAGEEEEELLVQCRGGCGWTGRRRDDDGTGLLEAHERGCVAALASRIDQLEQAQAEKTKDLASKVVSLSTTLRLQQEEQFMLNSIKKEKAAVGNSMGGCGSLAAAWWTCVLSYQTNPVQGAEIFVAPNNDNNLEDGVSWIRLHCIIPGISFFKGAKLEFTAMYNPLTLQTRHIRRLVLDNNGHQVEGPVFHLRDRNAELSLSELLHAMLRFATIVPLSSLPHQQEWEQQLKTKLKRLRCEAFDSTGKLTRSLDFVTLEKSKAMPSLFTTKPRTADSWVFKEDGTPPCPQLDFVGRVPDTVNLDGDIAATVSSFTPTKKIKVTNLPYFSDKTGLQDLFTDAGFTVVACEKQGSTKYRKIDTGHVWMRTSTDAMNAVERLRGRVVCKGRPVYMALDP